MSPSGEGGRVAAGSIAGRCHPPRHGPGFGPRRRRDAPESVCGQSAFAASGGDGIGRRQGKPDEIRFGTEGERTRPPASESRKRAEGEESRMSSIGSFQDLGVTLGRGQHRGRRDPAPAPQFLRRGPHRRDRGRLRGPGRASRVPGHRAGRCKARTSARARISRAAGVPPGTPPGSGARAAGGTCTSTRSESSGRRPRWWPPCKERRSAAGSGSRCRPTSG